jgi:hypothetical protein
VALATLPELAVTALFAYKGVSFIMIHGVIVAVYI